MINMFSVILFILKAIGILLMSVLGILLVLILALLFIPIQYSIDAKKYEDISVKLKIGWFLRILYFNMNYEKEKLSYQFRILGIVYKDSNRPKKIRQKRSKKKRKKKEENKIVSYDSSKTAKERLLEVREQRETIEENCVQKESPFPFEQVHKDTEEKKQSKFNVLSKIKNKIIAVIKKIKSIPKKIKKIILNLYKKVSLLKLFFQDKTNREGMKKTWGSIKEFTKHLLPKKIIANIRFGTGDPCSTGQILAGVSLLYAYYGKNVKIVPDFSESVIDGEVFLKGRIRLGTLLIITVKLIVNKNFKYLYKSYNKLKEEL